MLLALTILLSTPPSTGDRSFCSEASGTYKPNSTYSFNLRSLADALIGDATRLHSATGAAGEGPDRVYGAVLCRGDSEGPGCARRLREALGAIDGGGAAACALHKDVAFYSELYQLRFSDQDFLSAFSNAPEWIDVTNPDTLPHAAAVQFDEVVTELLSALADATARRPDRCAAGPEEMRYPRRADNNDLLLAWMDRRRRRAPGGLPHPLLDSGRIFMLLGALVLTWQQVTNCNVALVAFLLWLLGAALAMLSLVTRQFPRLAVPGAAFAAALRNYLLGGL